MQKSSTADLVHSIPALIAYLSKLMTLDPGDIVSTGTPAGVSAVKRGDVLEGFVEGIGTIEVVVV